MRKFLSLVAVALVAGLTTIGLAQAAQAYPDVNINLTVNRQVMYGGQSFTATATSNVNCSWSLSWNGTTRTSTGNEFVTTFVTSPVTKITKIPLRGTCVYATARVGARSAARAAAGSATWERTIVITVLPGSNAVSPPSTGGNLPNTGGPSLLILLGGLGLLLTGATAVTVARRRSNGSDSTGLVA